MTIYNYSGKIDYSTNTYKSMKKMYVTRDVARYHTTGRNVQWKDKVELFRFKVGDLYYELLNKDEAVVAYDASYASLSKEIVIPDKVTDNGHTFTVTRIDNEAFKGAAFTKVTLPSTITTVSEGAFSGCTKLTDVAFADEVTTIGKQAFVGCTALKELDLNKVANIAAEAFKGCTTLATMFSSYKGVINAHGMFQDIWAPIVEASLNIGLSIFFGHLWGLEGVILGVTTSLVLIIEIWKPIFLFKYGMKESPIPYFLGFGFRLAVILAIAYVSTWIVPYLPFHEEASTSIAKWLLYSTETTILVSLMIIPAFWAFSSGTKNFVKRMTSIITSEFIKRTGR